MKKFYLYNVAHPMAGGGKPIFIPFGEWNYDGTCRQRLDRAHGERIANELNARVAGGEPGIPVYQGHPDVPELAAKYPDKGALGWVTRIELANEGGQDGLALTVEWDRDPGRGFRWFSPYWVCGERDGMTNTLIVGEIASIGLVNNPNIPEFRLANERTTMKTYALPEKLVELAARRDAALANEANYDESKHPRAEDGKWTSGGGGGSSGGGTAPKPETKNGPAGGGKPWADQKPDDWSRDIIYRSTDITRDGMAERVNKAKMELGRATTRDDDIAFRKSRRASLHRAAISAGLRYNPKTSLYE